MSAYPYSLYKGDYFYFGYIWYRKKSEKKKLEVKLFLCYLFKGKICLIHST